MPHLVDRRSLLIAGASGTVTAGVAADRAGSAPGDARLPTAATGLDPMTVQQAYDRLAAAGGGILLLPPGRHKVAINATTKTVQIQGHGRGVTILEPAKVGHPAIRLLDARGDWTTTRLADFSIEGDPSLESDGIVFGHDTYRSNDEFIGRVSIERVGFHNLDRCIVRPFGNIGLFIDDCTFATANLHLWARNVVVGGGEMHAGCLQVSRSHFTGFRCAMAYLASGDTLSGQVSFTDCVFEAAHGFVFYVDGFRCVGGLPALAVRGCWNEITATGERVSVAGKPASKPRFLLARNCSAPITFSDTPLGTVELIASQVFTENCALDNLSDALLDGRSQLLHREARQASGTAPGCCLSIAGPTAEVGLHTPWFRVPLPIAISTAYADATRMCHNGSGVIVLRGARPVNSMTITGTSALPSSTQCQELVLPSGENQGLGETFATRGDCWLVVMVIYRKMAGGNVDLVGSGEHGFSGMSRLAADTWECLLNLSFDPGAPAGREGLFLHVDASATLQIGGIAVLEFGSRQDAIIFANSRTFPGAMN